MISNARHAIWDSHRGKGGATFESPTSNARYAIGDCDRGEGGAIIESTISNARYAIGDGDRGEGGAIIESRISNASDAVGCAVMGDNIGDCGSSEIRIVTTCYFHSCVAGDGVGQVTRFEIICPEACGGYECHEKKKKFFHNYSDLIVSK